MKRIAGLVMFFACALAFAGPAVEEQEEVRIYIPIEFFETDAAGKKGSSLGMPEMMEGGIKAKILEVCKTEEREGEKGNWCKIRLRLGMWMEDSSWIRKEAEVWSFLPEDAMIFRR